MNLVDLGPGVDRLAGVPVTLEGGPCVPSWGDAARTSAWRGVAHARERLVAVAFVTTSVGTAWVKRRRSWGNAGLVETGRAGDADAAQLLLTLGSWVWPEPREGTPEELCARSRGVVAEGGEVQVPVLTWGWRMHASFPVRGCEAPARAVPDRMEGETGRIIRALGEPSAMLAIDLLFLPRREVRARRSQIWSLKRRCRDDVPEPLRHVLCFGRSGHWPPERRTGQRYGP